MRSAQSGAFTGVIAGAVVIETSAVHLLLSQWPIAAWIFTASSAWLLWWLVSDYRAIAETSIRVEPDRIDGEVGRRLKFTVPMSMVKSAGPPRLMPSSGQPQGYVNATKPAAPNVLLEFRRPVPMAVLGLLRPVTQLALRLDDAPAFITAVTMSVPR